jgi:hypothetical protein
MKTEVIFDDSSAVGDVPPSAERTANHFIIAPLRGALNLREAATYLGVSVITVRRLIGRSLLHPNRATRYPLFPIRELDAFLLDPTNKKRHAKLPPQSQPGSQHWRKAVAASSANKKRK